MTMNATPSGVRTAGSSSPSKGSDYPAQAIGEHTFEITEGDAAREQFDFPLEGFGRFSSRLAERVAT